MSCVSSSGQGRGYLDKGKGISTGWQTLQFPLWRAQYSQLTHTVVPLFPTSQPFYTTPSYLHIQDPAFNITWAN